MLKKHCLSPRTLISAVLSAAILFSSFFTGITASAAPDSRVINSIESTSDLLWYDSSMNVTRDSQIFVQGDYSLKIGMDSYGTWKGMTVALPSAGTLAGVDAFYFFLRVPYVENQSDPFHFALVYEGEDGTQITHNDAFNVYLQAKGSAEWVASEYYGANTGNWGPNIPNGFEGYVKVPLTGAFAQWAKPDNTEVSFWNISKIMFYMCNFGGENGDIYFDALNYIPVDNGELIDYGQDVQLVDVKVLNPMERVADQSWSETNIMVDTTTEYAVQGTKAMKLSMDEIMNWQGITFPIAPTGILKDTEAIYFYLKTPTNENADNQNLWFQIIYEYDHVQLKHDGDFNIFLQPKGAKSWQTTTYWNDFGPNIPYGFEGYVKIPLTGAMKLQWTDIDETEIKLENVCRIGLYFSNFGGENGDIYLDALSAIPEDNGAVISAGNSFEIGDVDRDNLVGSEDLTLMCQMILGVKELDLTYSDMDLSGTLTLIDIVKLKKKLVASV